MTEGGHRASAFGLRLLGWSVLLLGLPIALLGAILPPNEYAKTLGIDALDCDGPSKVYIFAVPALLLYGAAFVVYGRGLRRRADLIVALLCIVVCAALAVNLIRARAEDQRQELACSQR